VDGLPSELVCPTPLQNYFEQLFGEPVIGVSLGYDVPSDEGSRYKTEPTTTDGKKMQMISTRQSTDAQGRHREGKTIWSDSDNRLRLESNSNQLKKKHKQHK